MHPFQSVSLSALIISILPFFSAQAPAAELRVAVASNFAGPATELAEQFEQHTAHKLRLSFGSTGKHYAQIKYGAPFDIFFAADESRPQRLEREGLAVTGTRFTYAVGKLVLWSPRTGYVDNAGKVLERADFRFLAIANPRFAPYGIAAREVLKSRGLWNTLQGKLVQGENIAQTYQFVSSGNAQLGFVAYAQLISRNETKHGSIWNIPPELYTPIRQQAVLLHDSVAARGFLNYLRGEKGMAIIKAHGYDVYEGQ
jgi:molybdate transport system substrate-binding protein